MSRITRIKIDFDYEDQPILITTRLGGFIVQTNPLRYLEAPLEMFESAVLGVYRLHGPVTYKRKADPALVNKMKNLIRKNLSFIELD